MSFIIVLITATFVHPFLPMLAISLLSSSITWAILSHNQF
jgi:hypothetical protein